MSLKQKALNGIFWSAVDKITNRGISFVIGILIARILSPADYGLVGMIAIFIALSTIIIDSGFSQALVQRKNRTQEDFSTAFFFNIALASICYVIIYLLAPIVAQFYHTDQLVSILRVSAIAVVINSLCTVQRANLLIKMDFRTTAFVNVISVAISGGVGIYMAYNGYGVWALVYQTIINQSVATLLLWGFGGWSPTFVFSKYSFKVLYSFGSKLLIAGTISTVMREIYAVMIGRMYKVSDLGYYTRATQMTDVISFTANEIVNSVTFPILASIQDEKDRMISVYGRMLSMTAFFIFPIMTIFAVISAPMINVLLTDKWAPAIPLIQWLCFARLFTPISSLNMNLLNAVGRSDLFLKLDLCKIPLIILSMIITIPISVKAIVIGNVIVTFICYFINAYLPGKLFGFGVKSQFKVFYKIILTTAITALITHLSMMLFDDNLTKLVIGCFSSVVSYYLLSLMFKVNEVYEINKLIKKYINR